MTLVAPFLLAFVLVLVLILLRNSSTIRIKPWERFIDRTEDFIEFYDSYEWDFSLGSGLATGLVVIGLITAFYFLP